MKENDMKPLVSVVIPAYNRARTIAKAIVSVQAQTFTDWEIIVVDDGSKDETCSIVERLAHADPRIRLLRHQQNKRAQAARNTGIKAAKGEWISFLDSDDEYLPESIKSRFEVAQRDRVSVVHSECYIIKPGEPRKLYGIRPLAGQVYKDMLEKEGPVFPALLIKKAALGQIGLLDEQILAYQEWDTCIRLAKHFPFGYSSTPTFVYDYRCEDAMSRNAILNGRGYEQIFTKHKLDILKINGAGNLSEHYEVAARWFGQGKDFENEKRCRRQALLWKCLSPRRALSKAKHLLIDKSRRMMGLLK